MKKLLCLVIVILTGISANFALASLIIPMVMIDQNGQDKSIGMIRADDTIYGLLLTPQLHGLPPGVHGFHVHQMPMCGSHGMAAGGHLDPQRADKHNGPYNGNGHLGDLPILVVDAKGNSTLPMLAPRLKLAQIQNRTLMIHVGGDNYSDTPEKLGGGDGRL